VPQCTFGRRQAQTASINIGGFGCGCGYIRVSSSALQSNDSPLYRHGARTFAASLGDGCPSGWLLLRGKPAVRDLQPSPAEIKDVTSPVFTSKFCHFLAPRIFPIVDNLPMGNPFPTYEAYFTAGRAEWLSTDSTTQDALIGLLTNEVGATVQSARVHRCAGKSACNQPEP
jgi:hypothetical protein